MMTVRRKKEFLETATNPEVGLGMMEIDQLDAQQFSITHGALSGLHQAIRVLFLKGSEKDYQRRGEQGCGKSATRGSVCKN